MTLSRKIDVPFPTALYPVAIRERKGKEGKVRRGFSWFGATIFGAVCAVACLGASDLGAEVRFEPVAVAEHVYDGGWTHFVGGGVAVFDCDGDARPEMVAAGGENPVTLFRNHGQMSFSAITMDITGTTGLYPIDLDGDGRLDLVVLRVGPDVLLRGDGACGFEPMDLPGFAPRAQWSTAFSATWEPGATRPSLAFGHYVDRTDPEGPFEACDTNSLWRPVAGRYAETLLTPGHCALSILFTDWNRDGRADLRVSNDRHYYVRDGQEQIWRFDPEPRLLGEADGWQTHRLWGMGIATRDLDGDGRDEVYLSSMGDQRLMRWTGSGARFEDVPFEMGTTAHRPYTGGDGRPSTGWHIAFGDVQNDGRDDVFIAKGNVQQMPGNAMDDPNNLLIQQADGRFAEVGAQAGVASMHRGRGAALADLDGDGRLDLVVVNRAAPLEVWRNVSTAGNWLEVALRGPDGNRLAIGAWIEVDTGHTVQSREVLVGGGHAGGTALAAHFGLGEVDTVRVRVKPNGGAWGAWQPASANQRLTLDAY